MSAVRHLTKVTIVLDRASAHIANFRSAGTSHFIAALFLEKSLMTCWAFPDSSICHGFFDGFPRIRVRLLLHLYNGLVIG